MSYFTDFVRGFLDLGATVILPVVIFLLGLFFRQKIGADSANERWNNFSNTNQWLFGI